MKKLFLAGLLLFSLNSLDASEADRVMNRYVPHNERNELINRDYIEQRNNRLNNAIKGVYLAKMDKNYDISWCSYLKSYFVDTQDSRVIRDISRTEQQLQNQHNMLHNNTWEQWGWAAAKYSAVAIATIAILKTYDYCLLPQKEIVKEAAPAIAKAVIKNTAESMKESASAVAESVKNVAKNTITQEITANSFFKYLRMQLPAYK